MQTSQHLPEGFAMLGAGPKSCEGDRARPCANSPCRSAARLLPGSAGGEQSAGSAQVLSQGWRAQTKAKGIRKIKASQVARSHSDSRVSAYQQSQHPVPPWGCS